MIHSNWRALTAAFAFLALCGAAQAQGWPDKPIRMVDSPWKSLADAVKAAKAKPGEIKQALAGSGTVGHLAGEMLARRAGVKVLNVPYKGAAPAITDLLGGQTDYMFATPQAVAGMIKGAKLRALAVTSKERLPILPEVPTVAESGYKDPGTGGQVPQG